jgi:NAD(P)H-dependent FMN reductase
MIRNTVNDFPETDKLNTMKKIIAFGASSSKESINHTLAKFTADQLKNVEVEILDLNDFEMPIYSIDRENQDGIHPKAQEFIQTIQNADGIIISFAEHNGIFTAAYKNVYDWASRIEQRVWGDKQMLLMATSPGGRGGSSVLNFATTMYQYSNPNVVGSFSLPSFYQNFNTSLGITQPELKESYTALIQKFQNALDAVTA